MRFVSTQFGHPRGLMGRLVGRGMARRNAEFNRWVIGKVAGEVDAGAARVVELGSGPGVGVQELLRSFPQARVQGIDPSRLMVGRARRLNQTEIEAGRLSVIEGDTRALANVAPVDLVVAVHVLYFWHDPATELGRVRAALRPDGLVAIGYRLRADMPAMSQRDFPATYASDEDVATLLIDAGFRDVRHSSQDGSRGRVVIGRA